MKARRIRPIAIHLPQFHPIPENNKWWGDGFTEWTNVTKAKPLFKGHYQPQLPKDLGFYDLRLHESLMAQAQMASKYGFEGFCFYHYWFNGKRLLEKPVQNIISSDKPNFPFMLCWANENWSRRWDGLDNEVLIEQNYSLEDDDKHINYLIEIFKDKRYIRIDNKPVFIIYKPFLIPHLQQTITHWRKVALEFGIELYLCHMVFSYSTGWDKKIQGFDAVIDFEPFGIRRKNILERVNKIYNKEKLSIVSKIRNMYSGKKNYEEVPFEYNLHKYSSMYTSLKSVNDFDFKIFPSLVPGWDNSPRRKENPSLILHESTPSKYAEWLEKILDDFKPYSSEENLVFINAWNEWAEGNHLEPCLKWGNEYLKITQHILSHFQKQIDFD